MTALQSHQSRDYTPPSWIVQAHRLQRCEVDGGGGGRGGGGRGGRGGATRGATLERGRTWLGMVRVKGVITSQRQQQPP